MSGTLPLVASGKERDKLWGNENSVNSGASSFQIGSATSPEEEDLSKLSVQARVRFLNKNKGDSVPNQRKHSTPGSRANGGPVSRPASSQHASNKRAFSMGDFSPLSVLPTLSSSDPHLDTSHAEPEDEQKKNVLRIKKAALLPLIEDVSDWLNQLLGLDISADGFMERIDTGVVLCKLVSKIQEGIPKNEDNKKLLAPLKHRETADPGSWFARDNAASFLSWCSVAGIKAEMMFESDDLVSRRNPRLVVICLLELSRIAGKYGLMTTALVQMENEPPSPPETPPLILPPTPRVEIVRGSSENAITESDDGASKSDDITAESGENTTACDETVSIETERIPVNMLTPPDSPPDSDKKTALASISSARPSSSKGTTAKLNLHSQVKALAAACTCSEPYLSRRAEDGKYVVGRRKQCLIRHLRGKHIMIRVGGGWDTLEHYLLNHDPCRVLQFRREGNSEHRARVDSAGGRKGGGDVFLAAPESRYRAASANAGKSGKGKA